MLWAAGGVVLALSGAWRAGVRLNLTASLPVGLYVVTPGSPTRGAIVLACLPSPVTAFARDRSYIPRGACPGDAAPVGKEVLAVPGDTVTVSVAGLSVNGSMIPETQARVADSDGRRLPLVPAGRSVVQSGEIWLVGRHPLSFDSRYFGAVPSASVVALVHPLWVVRNLHRLAVAPTR